MSEESTIIYTGEIDAFDLEYGSSFSKTGILEHNKIYKDKKAKLSIAIEPDLNRLDSFVKDPYFKVFDDKSGRETRIALRDAGNIHHNMANKGDYKNSKELKLNKDIGKWLNKAFETGISNDGYAIGKPLKDAIYDNIAYYCKGRGGIEINIYEIPDFTNYYERSKDPKRAKEAADRKPSETRFIK